MTETAIDPEVSSGLPARQTGERPEPCDGPAVILFDGVCNLCSWGIQFMARRSKATDLRFAMVQSATGQALLAKYGIPQTDWESWILIDKGKAFTKSQAYFQTLPYLYFPWPLFGLFRIIPRKLADWLYDRVAKNRYRLFGRKNVCMVPDADIISRFYK